jgi:3',5'-cyclic AMP phosphodiesterase CpdA
MTSAKNSTRQADALRLIQISDIHLSARRPFFQHNFEALRDALASEDADCVVCSGDMTLDGAENPDELAFAAEQLKRLGREILLIPGNHDIGNSLPDVRGGEVTISAARRAAYCAALGPDFWVRDTTSWRLVGLNTMLPGSGLAAEAEQDAMLDEAVADLGGRNLIVFGHKPLYFSDAAEALRTQGALFPEHRQRWADRLIVPRSVTYLSGHIHEVRRARWGSIRQVWAPSIAFVMDAANRHGRPDRPKRKPGIKRTGYLRHTFTARGHRFEFVEPAGFLITDLGNWFSDPRGFHARYADEPWRGIASTEDATTMA